MRKVSRFIFSTPAENRLFSNEEEYGSEEREHEPSC